MEGSAVPLSDHEQRILEEIEARLREEDPRLAETVSSASVHAHAIRRIRWGVVLFALGFVMLMTFMVSLWIGIAGFAVMLVSALFVYQNLRRMGQDQIQAASAGGRLSLTAALARLADRFRSRPPRDE
jgi:asparagine N-glycosylation enzyme membrane subunit Stt3